MYRSTSAAAMTSRIECIASCGAPTSTVIMPVRAALSGPIVEPHGRSARCTYRWSGTPACSQASANAAAPRDSDA